VAGILEQGKKKELRNPLDASGLQAVSLLVTPGGGPGFNPASPSPEERDATVHYYNEVIDLALDLGAQKVLYIVRPD
jgi:fructoselysine 3-epimerase